ncbi:MAG: hypothetical protein FWF23_02525 [Alphaproteobacteria bacterium]|nr:hypothetical protein [Alphaproteobacteria bacterium]
MRNVKLETKNKELLCEYSPSAANMHQLRTPHSTLHTSSKGFTLTEAAIVLGVIGLIMAGIWSVAASMMHTVRHADFSEMMVVVLENVRSVYANVPNFKDMNMEDMKFMKNANVFPGNFVVVKGKDKGKVLTPLANSTLEVCSWDSGGTQASCANPVLNNPTLFAFEYTFSSFQDCLTALVRNSDPTAYDGLVAVRVQGVNIEKRSSDPNPDLRLPWTVGDVNISNSASYACKGASVDKPVRVNFIFRLNP